MAQPRRQKAVWQKPLQTAADPDRVRHYLRELQATAHGAMLNDVSSEQARALAALWSGSPAMSDLLVAHPLWLDAALTVELLKHPRREQGYRREVHSCLKPRLEARDYPRALDQLREFKQREMLRIAARDLARLGDTIAITRELSDLADVCLKSVLAICREQLSARLGQPYQQDQNGCWQPTEFAVLGLGKLGGQELNYSSDVDILFVYSEEGHVFKEPPRKGASVERALTNHQFFKRLAEDFIAEVTRASAEGTLYRIDLRLRPEGDTGPLVRSLSSYENYYAQWGQTWERLMLMKARHVAGDAAVAAEFLETIQPFRYPRSLSEGVLREMAAMKARIETDVLKAGEIERNVKLGRGGIREIEFVAQTLQLLHAGRIPFLQGAPTLPTLEKLVQYRLLAPPEANSLSAAYCFLRDVEHRLQMEHNLQTHTIPAGHKARARLAALMGFSSLKEFEAALRTHTRNVRSIYDKFLKAETPREKDNLPRQFEGTETEWRPILEEHGFQDVNKSIRLLNEFAHGPGYVHVSPRTVELAWQLLPRFFALCPTPARLARMAGGEEQAAKGQGSRNRESSVVNRDAHVLSDPDRVLTRLDSFITAYGTRAMLFETWASNPSLFELLLLLFDRSEFLAEMAIRTPDLVDELVLSGRLRRRKTAEETLQDLRHGRADEDQRLWIRRYHQAELMRIGLRDILGLADFEQNLGELSALADACLQYVFEVVLRKHKLKKPPLAIIGLGKLGGRELNYGSDLDIIFVADPKTKNLSGLQRLAIDTMELLSSRTELGVAFMTDPRLRPDGEKGLLVNTLDAYEDYYRRRAQLWEIQSISRSRPIAGNQQLGEQFLKLAGTLSDFTSGNVATGFRIDGHRRESSAPSRRNQRATPSSSAGLAAYTPPWKEQIAHMRDRIEKERTPRGQEALAIKTGAGGLMDAEFIAQTLCLALGWHEPNTLQTLQRAREAKTLKESDAAKLIDNYRRLRRVEGILRRWRFAGETVLPAEPAPFYRVSVRCGFATPEAFRKAIAAWRRGIREVYDKVLGVRQPIRTAGHPE